MVTLVAVPACGASTTSVEARASAPRASTAGVSSQPAVDSINALGANLYERLVAGQQNLVFSPYSIAVALAMARNGATGETRSEMDSVLHAGPGDALDRALNLLDQQLAQRSGHRGTSQRNGNVELDTANALWAQEGAPFGPAFLTVLAEQYGAGLQLVDYKASAEAARRTINAWVSDRTKAKITDLLPAGSIDASTRLVLANAIYLKAPWAKKFDPLGDEPFRLPDGSMVMAPAMTAHEAGTYGAGPGWQAAQIPYVGGELAMTVIVPEDLASFETTLDGPRLGVILNSVTQPLFSLQMPKFTFRTTVPLKEELSALGMPDAFTDAAEFSAITRGEPLRISDVFHQAFIAVDEQGTEAAAATAVAFEAVGAPVQTNTLVVDRPFLFAIRDLKTGAVLFLGRVADPTR